MAKKRVTPREARTGNSIRKLPHDNVSDGQFWALVNEGTITIAAQNDGNPATAIVSIERGFFNALVDWWNTGVWKANAMPRRKRRSPIRRRRSPTEGK